MMHRSANTRNGRWSVAGSIVAAAAIGAALAAPGPASAALPAESSVAKTQAAKVNVVHGIPRVKVKVCVDGKAAIRGFTYGEKVVGVPLPAGQHRVRVVPAGKGCHAAAILKDRYRLEAGKNYTIVAGLKPSGTPRLKAFVNRVGPVDAGKARLTVRHTAQAPAVNVWAGSTKLIGGECFTWGHSRTFTVPKGEYRVKVTLPASKKPVIGPRWLTLDAGKAYQVHAVGKAGHYRLIVVRVPVGTT